MSVHTQKHYENKFFLTIYATLYQKMHVILKSTDRMMMMMTIRGSMSLIEIKTFNI